MLKGCCLALVPKSEIGSGWMWPPARALYSYPHAAGPHMPSLSTRSRAALTITVCALLLAVVGFAASEFWTRESTAAPPDADESTISDGVPHTVTLPESKAAVAGIQTETVKLGGFSHAHSLPGRIDYNDNHHIELKAPSSGVLVSVLVKPGEHVDAGQIIAWLNSTEIGAARADVMKCEANQELAKAVFERQARIKKNVDDLNRGLEQRTEFDTLNERFWGRLLGDYPKELFAAYSRLILAEFDVKNSASMAEARAIAGRVFQERKAESRAALAELEAESEQAEQDVLQYEAEARAAYLDATRRTQIAKQHLSSLLLEPEALTAPSDSNADPQAAPTLSTKPSVSQSRLSQIAIRAPFSGTIEARHFAARERVQLGDSLFVLADTQSLWVTAEIRENDWPAIQVAPGQQLDVTVPALADRHINAQVDFIGREVSGDSNAIPIVAVINNSDGMLRPGLFVRVSVPIRASTGAISVDARAIQQHDGQAFVFIDEGRNRYRRVDVETGETSNSRVEVKLGVEPNDVVVTSGAFILKSELLLEGD